MGCALFYAKRSAIVGAVLQLKERNIEIGDIML